MDVRWGLGLIRGWILRKMGGVFVDVCGEEVFHCCGVEHGGCRVASFSTRVVDVVEGAGLGVAGRQRVKISMFGTGGCACSIQELRR